MRTKNNRNPTEKQFFSLQVKVPVDIIKAARIAAIQEDILFRDWIARAIYRELGIEEYKRQQAQGEF